MFDLTIHLGDVLLALLSLVIIPFVSRLNTTLSSLRETVSELKLVVFGAGKDLSSGVLGDIAALQKESQRHRNWLIELQVQNGHIRRDDRS